MQSSREARSVSRSRSRSRSKPKTKCEFRGKPPRVKGRADLAKKPHIVTKIIAAVKANHDRKGTSIQTIRKSIAATTTTGVSAKCLNTQIRRAIDEALQKGILVRPKGSQSTGCRGRFLLSQLGRKPTSTRPRASPQRQRKSSKRQSKSPKRRRSSLKGQGLSRGRSRGRSRSPRRKAKRRRSPKKKLKKSIMRHRTLSRSSKTTKRRLSSSRSPKKHKKKKKK
ncbi:sperm-specific protein PHI-2B-like [Gigantopelta aegis]|uniref:sperm-specific protein PHI-2B-like n=1 Tax=Gigantopelta aegis TaxID=1735272 RepID=UPI001B8894E3|nr:sperm-specific protein PHI-2B-like [Gigantopelta aegis]